jgi:biotin carboxylase
VKVVFISPQYPPEMLDFTRGLSEVGVQIIGVSDQPFGQLPESVRRRLSGYVQAPIFDENAGTDAIVKAVARAGVDRVETLWEPCVVLAAKVRKALGIPGMSPEVALRFRDKGLMKEAAIAGGVRVPKAVRVRTAKEAWEAAEIVGFPLIIKPIAGAGTADTFRCFEPKQLEAALQRTQHVVEASVEEYIDGEEFTYDTVCIDGNPVFENVAQYHPRPIEGRTNEWISPAQHVFRNPYIPELMPGIELGRKTMRALGMTTGFTHMEWYKKADGEVVLGEIACRSGGGKLVDMMNFSNDFDVYREWARSVAWKSFDAKAQRKYFVGMVFKRAIGRGRIARIEGLERVHQRCGQWLVEDGILPIGTPRRDWKATLLSDGYITVRHPDLAECMAMMRTAITDLRLYAA